MADRALVIGALGQDGSYMIELLEEKGFDVYGVVKEGTAVTRLSRVKNFPADLLDISEAERVIKTVQPSVIYNFAGVSDVFSPFSRVDEILKLNALLPQNILDVISRLNPAIRFFQASSCLIFGKDTSGFQNEQTPPNPIYPYGASKLYADNLVKMYRERGLFACSGIFFNHESPRRREHFFSRIITNAAKEKQKIKVGNLSTVRDYGFAPDFMEAAYLIMTANQPNDYVIGTGNLISMESFAEKVFAFAGLDYRDFIETDETLVRTQDTNILRADIAKIKTELNWTPKHTIDDLVKAMMNETAI